MTEGDNGRNAEGDPLSQADPRFEVSSSGREEIAQGAEDALRLLLRLGLAAIVTTGTMGLGLAAGVAVWLVTGNARWLYLAVPLIAFLGLGAGWALAVSPAARRNVLHTILHPWQILNKRQRLGIFLMAMGIFSIVISGAHLWWVKPNSWWEGFHLQLGLGVTIIGLIDEVILARRT